MDPIITTETLALLKKCLTAGDDLAKTITTSSGFTAYDLQAPAKNLYPVVTPLRNAIPRVQGRGGTATNWRILTSIVGSGYDNMPWIPEGQRSGRMSYTAVPKAANYVTLGEEDGVTFEAQNAGRGFEDVRAACAMRLLQKLMLKEERAILGGNASVSLGTPSTPTLTASGSGATLTAATYSVYAVALTMEGYWNSSLANGVATTKTITGADGGTYTLKGGSSNKSSAATQAVTLGQTLYASVTAVSGAVAYAWYAGTSGSETLQAITTINSVAFSSALSSSYQLASAISSDCSNNSGLAFDGLFSSSIAGGGYLKTMSTGTAGTGTGLTSTGRGSVYEIDMMFKAMWDLYQISPTVLYVSSQEIQNISNKILLSGSAPLLEYQMRPGAGESSYSITAGGVISAYFNPFTANGGIKVPVKLHPNLPAGTIVGYCEQLPLWYQNNNVENVAEIHTRADYNAIDWQPITRRNDMGVYAEEVLAVYAPFAMGVITNIGNS